MAEIVNIVISVKVSESFNLDYLANHIDDATFGNGPKRWLKMRVGPEKTYVALYRSGKFSIVGLKDLKKVQNSVNLVLSILQKNGVVIEQTEIKINNIVLLDKILLAQSLENLTSILDAKKTSYEPEQFPGLIYRDTGYSILLFSSGKLVIAGCKDLDTANKAIEQFKSLIGIKS